MATVAQMEESEAAAAAVARAKAIAALGHRWRRLKPLSRHGHRPGHRRGSGEWDLDLACSPLKTWFHFRRKTVFHFQAH